MCYPGQNFDMSVPVPEGPTLDEPGLLDLAERFHDQHEAERGFASATSSRSLRGVRLVAAGPYAEARAPRRAGHGHDADEARTGDPPGLLRRRSSSTRRCTTAAGSAPAPRSTGPALVEEPFTVVVVPPGAARPLDDTGNYELTL